MYKKGVNQGQKRTRTPAVVAHAVRTADGGQKTLKYGRKQAVFLCCTECMGWDAPPSECRSPLCPLFPFKGKTMASQRGTLLPLNHP